MRVLLKLCASITTTFTYVCRRQTNSSPFCFSHPRESHAGEGRSASASMCPASDFAGAFLRLQTLQLSRCSVRRCVAVHLTTEEGSWQAA